MSDFTKATKNIKKEIDRTRDKLDIHYSKLDEVTARDLFEEPFSQFRTQLNESDRKEIFDLFYKTEGSFFQKFNSYITVVEVMELALIESFGETLDIESNEEVEGFTLSGVKQYVRTELKSKPNISNDDLKALLESVNAKTLNHISRELADYIFDLAYELGSYADSIVVSSEYFNFMEFLKKVPF